MIPDIRFNPGSIDVDGTANFLGQIVSTQFEVTSHGKVAGYSFSDRSDFTPVDGAGHRWVWYCQDQTARLWSGSDVLSVGLTNGKAVLKVGGIDMKAEIDSLKATVHTMSDTINALNATANDLARKMLQMQTTINDLRQKQGSTPISR